VTSRRSRKEQVASAEISVDNIVEGGRRKRAKFDSSVSTPLQAAMLGMELTSCLLQGATSLRSSSSPYDRVSLLSLTSETN
jgi:hypothetical protein